MPEHDPLTRPAGLDDDPAIPADSSEEWIEGSTGLSLPASVESGCGIFATTAPYSGLIVTSGPGHVAPSICCAVINVDTLAVQKYAPMATGSSLACKCGGGRKLLAKVAQSDLFARMSAQQGWSIGRSITDCMMLVNPVR